MSVELSDRPETNIPEVNSVKYDTFNLIYI